MAGSAGGDTRRLTALLHRIEYPAPVQPARRLIGTRPVFERVRFALLVAVGALLAHDAVFAAQYGLGRTRDDALAATAHAYWPAFAVLTLLAAAVGTGWAIAGLARLSRRLRGLPAVEAAAGGYVREVVRLWPRLFLAGSLAFLVQENVEHLAVGNPAPGLYALSAPGYPLALPIIAAVTGLLAAAGGWLRWRRETLVLRLRAARMSWLRRVVRIGTTTRKWRLVAALVALGRILARTDAGRAPPVAASP